MEEITSILFGLIGAFVVLQMLMLLASQTRAQLVQFLRDEKAFDAKSAIEMDKFVRSRFFMALMWPRSTRHMVFTDDGKMYIEKEQLDDLILRIHNTLKLSLWFMLLGLIGIISLTMVEIVIQST